MLMVANTHKHVKIKCVIVIVVVVVLVFILLFVLFYALQPRIAKNKKRMLIVTATLFLWQRSLKTPKHTHPVTHIHQKEIQHFRMVPSRARPSQTKQLVATFEILQIQKQQHQMKTGGYFSVYCNDSLPSLLTPPPTL